ALPITPGGLGVVDSVAPLLLVSFGVPASVATLGVLAWRLVNFWLPIPVGALAYISLKVPRGAGLKAMRAAVSTLMSHGDQSHEAAPAESGPAESGPAESGPAESGPAESGPAENPPESAPPRLVLGWARWNPRPGSRR